MYSSVLLAASVYKSVGYIVAVIVFLAVIVYAFINVRRGRAEVGSELELAANRKPYYDDEVLEGRVLDRALTWGLILLGVIALTLPLYWLNEPGRQEGAVEDFNRKFTDRGAELFATTEDGGLNCAGCHGPEGVGGVASYTLTDPNGEFVDQVDWQAPALNTVLWRFSEDEVRYILEYGRPFSPMPAWGVVGGGPLNEQQIQNLIDYMWTIQLTPEEMQSEVQGELDRLTEAEGLNQNDPRELGEALFNLGFDSGFAGGAYSCGRCHTQGWSYGDEGIVTGEIPDGSGAFGPNLTNGDTERQFPTNEAPAEGESEYQDMIDFITIGSENGKQYGAQGLGSGRMPGFGVSPNAIEDVQRLRPDLAGMSEDVGMLTPEQVEAIVIYEREVIGQEGQSARSSD
ncbi:MAG: cytochrome c [Acidimicrobiales bacterium]|nr:cytochrome c [Acidimicrobiales bacterium]